MASAPTPGKGMGLSWGLRAPVEVSGKAQGPQAERTGVQGRLGRASENS